MDTIADPDIKFDENGICNYYYEYKEAETKYVFKGEEGKRKLEETIKPGPTKSKGKKYDCILGLSGGADSTYCSFVD